MDTKLEELIDELQQQAVLTAPIKPFNQPDLIAISSIDRTAEDPNANGFSSFSVNLPLPAISVKSLQLLQTNIPQANANIPNSACVFWYYRLSEYSGFTPSINNLHYVRLLPTTYKQEYIYQPTQYGYNQTFNNYTAVATQLAKSCATDLLLNNVEALAQFEDEDFQVNRYVPFIPNDVSITYDSASNKFQMTGLNTEVAYLEYDANTLYAVGDIITNAERTTAKVNLLGSRGVSPTDNTFVEWFASNSFVVGNVVRFNNIVYQVIAAGQNVSLNPAVQTPTYYTRLGRLLPVASYSAWVSATNYAVGDAVSYNGVVYVLFADGETTTINPSLQPTKWVSQPTQITAPSSFWAVKNNIEIVGEWYSGMFYPVGTIVYYEGALYQSTSFTDASFSSLPTNTTYWDLFTAPANWYRYLITGYEDPNVRKLQGELFNLEWNSTRTYNVDARVFHNGIPYIALKTNRGDEPLDGQGFSAWSDSVVYSIGDIVVYGGRYFESFVNNNLNLIPTAQPESWEVIGVVDSWAIELDASSPLKTGLYGMTAQYDMTEFIGNEGVLINFPFGVGGQPYNPNPRRLLNSILGFTWGGAFNPAELTDIESYITAVLTTSKQPLLYNRLRPVPDYRVSIAPPAALEGELGQDVAATVSLTYTADSYANLVYSSIISIYADIVKASSVDTQGATRLLALTSMNCGNLGIAFWANYIENPLLKVQGDIYSVFIEFRDEFGEPFMLSNNAVATLTFKLNY